MNRILTALSALKLPSTSPAQHDAPDTRPSANPSAQPRVRAATPQDIGSAIRFLVVLSAIGVIGAAKLAITSQTQQLSVRLDHARSEVSRSEIRRERLLVERAMLRQPQRLQVAALQLGLEAPVAVIDLPAVVTP